LGLLLLIPHMPTPAAEPEAMTAFLPWYEKAKRRHVLKFEMSWALADSKWALKMD